MLGIGQITTRVAELIRGALPYAIVNNDPNQSVFSRLVSYKQVQHALDAGHKWIKVKASDVDYNEFTVSTNYATLESNWGATFTNTNTASGQNVIDVDSDYCRLSGFHTYTAGGATSNDRRGFDVAGDYNYINGCLVTDSDGSGFVTHGIWNSYSDCHVIDSDDYGFYTNGQGVRILGCTVNTCGNTQRFYHDSGSDNFTAVANIALNGGTYYMASGATNGLLVGSMLDGGTDNYGTGIVITGNKTF